MHLPVVGPFPASALFSYLRSRLVEGVESCQGVTWRRQLPEGSLEVTAETGHLVVTGPSREPTTAELARVARLFVPDRDWSPPEVFLNDPVLAPLVARAPGFRPLGCWEPFELVLRTVVGQQVSVAAAGTLMRRLGERAGGWSPTQVADADLAALGMPGTRVATLKTFARSVADGRLMLDGPWQEVRAALATLPGFGPWTLDYLAIRLGRDLDAFPASDLGLLRGTGCRTSRELLAHAERWRPFRGWAAAYLWSPSPQDHKLDKKTPK